MTASVSLHEVSKWYGEVLGLNEVSANFGPGVTGLLGPNGAGKSTLMKLVCGMLRPNLGEVRVCGVAPFSNPAVMRRIGLCPEQDAAYPRAGVLDVLTYLTRLHGFSAREARTRSEAALRRVGLGHVLERSASTFSKGMRQRTKLAQALVHDPDVLILDEPLNGLDPPGRKELSAIIRELGAEGRCVVVSSHVLHEVQVLAERVLFLNWGRILADGTVAEIRAELPEFPLTVRVATTEPARLARCLLELDGVLRVERTDGGLEVLSRSPNELFDRIAAAAQVDGIPIGSLLPMDEDLEAVFRYLTR
ncbi:MAG: ABC transporter ATP-binding protein [Planctomycetota bacterium]|jgi:ABC-2 type transport system ATP-binding protein